MVRGEYRQGGLGATRRGHSRGDAVRRGHRKEGVEKCKEKQEGRKGAVRKEHNEGLL